MEKIPGPKTYLKKNPEKNRADAKLWYDKNRVAVQKRRAERRLKDGYTVRVSTLKKYDIPYDKDDVEGDDSIPVDETLKKDAKGKPIITLDYAIMKIKEKNTKQRTIDNKKSKLGVVIRGLNCEDNIGKCLANEKKVIDFIKQKKYANNGKDYLGTIVALADKEVPELKKWITKNKIQAYRTFMLKGIYESQDKAEEKTQTEPVAFKWNKFIEQVDKMKNDTKEQVMQRLLMQLYKNFQLRDDFGDLLILNSKKDENKRNDEKKNYYNKRTGVITLNAYKTSDKYKRVRYTVPTELKNEINDSLKDQPRDYLITQPNSKPYPNRELKKLIPPILKKMGLKGSLVDIRRSRISHAYDSEKLKSEAREKLAKLMLHSRNMQQNVYRRVVTDD